MIEIKPPRRLIGHENSLPKVFLGGSIEMGSAEDWQTRLVNACSDLDCVMENPRRDNWDSSWEQRSSNPQFNEQVNWELDHLENADIAVFYFDPNTKSPITLMELGHQAAVRTCRAWMETAEGDGQIVLVCCPDGYWRKGNVEIMCERSRIPLFDSFESLLVVLRAYIIRANGLPSKTD